MKLTNVERETVILFNEAEPTASVYTCNGRIRRRLEELAEKGIEGINFVRSDNYSVTYTIPKKWVKINAQRKVSEKQKEILRYARNQRGKNNDLNTAHTTVADTNTI